MTGTDLPDVRTALPGPVSRAYVDKLAQTECPAITARRARRADLLGAADDDPIVWEAALGANVQDVDGNRYVDLTSGFGVAFVGHRHPDVVQAVSEQTNRLVHAMGDAWPDATRIRMLERLTQITPPGLDVCILGLSGSDAVEATVKTALLATGRSGVITFSGGYHGLSLGTVALQGYKASFAKPFQAIHHPNARHLPWGCSMEQVQDALAAGEVGLVMAEPIQGRGGMRPARTGWLAELAEVTRRHGALFALDEIQSGVGRTGSWFASTYDSVVPDVMCVGKALAGGWPLSVCVGTRQVMNAWGASVGEAIHTQTFLGHPVGCAAALSVLNLIERDNLLKQAIEKGGFLRRLLEDRGLTVRGRGLMMGIELGQASLTVSRALMRRGFLVLPAGVQGEALGLTPPVCITEEQMTAFVDALSTVLSGGDS